MTRRVALVAKPPPLPGSYCSIFEPTFRKYTRRDQASNDSIEWGTSSIHDTLCSNGLVRVHLDTRSTTIW
jgi:hypothetical protein